jgi:hypothetical protein
MGFEPKGMSDEQMKELTLVFHLPKWYCYCYLMIFFPPRIRSLSF